MRHRLPLLAALAALLTVLPAAALHAHPDDAGASPRISLNVKDADLEDVFRLFADVGDLNVVLDQAVKGKTITLMLTDVPLEQALDLVLRTHGLGSSLEGNVLRVAPLGKLTTEAQQRKAFETAREEAGDLHTVARTFSNATAADAERMVKPYLSSRGTTTVDKRTNTLILRDIDSKLEELVGVLDLYDPASPLPHARASAGPSTAGMVNLAILTFEVPRGLVDSLGLTPMREMRLPGGLRVRPFVGSVGDSLQAVVEGSSGAATLHEAAALLGVDQPLTLDLAALRASAAAPPMQLVLSPRLDGGNVVMTWRLGPASGGASAAWYGPADRPQVVEIVAPTPTGEVRHAILIEADSAP